MIGNGMNDEPIGYGPNSPFSGEERAAIAAVYHEVKRSEHPQAARLAEDLLRQVKALDAFGDVLAQYPSPLEEQTLGRQRRGLDTLMDSLSRSTPSNFEFFLPTRALVGRGLDMAEVNFYRFLRHICEEVLDEKCARPLIEAATRCVCVCLYTKLAEEVLSDIASDPILSSSVRRKAVARLAQIWERRLTYRVREFFPLLEATWVARQQITVTGGTLMGTQELFELLQAGCDPRFVDCFARDDQSEDETEAFREFLFDSSAEKLNQLAQEMDEAGIHSVSLYKETMASQKDLARLFYEFFRSRHALAVARKLANLPGPKRTAEGYVMIHYLDRAD